MQVRLLFIGLWTLADKEGRLEDRPKRIKAELFPYDNLEIDTLLSRLQSAGFITRYEVGEMKVVQVSNFSKHQRITGSEVDTVSDYPPPPQGNNLETHGNTEETPWTTGREGKGTGRERKGKDIGSGDPGAAGAPPDVKKIFEGIERKKNPLYAFIRDYRPDFIEPYVELWNIFAAERGKALVSKISEARRKKFKNRIGEKAFDFLKVLEKAGKAGDFLSTSKWFTFDWITDSESNYLKVIEGNYDKEQPKLPAGAKEVSKEDINRIYGLYRKGDMINQLLTERHCDLVIQEKLISVTENHVFRAIQMRVQALAGSNLAAELRMVEAYQSGRWEEDPDCKTDEPNRIRIAKKIALIDLFGYLKQTEKEAVFA